MSLNTAPIIKHAPEPCDGCIHRSRMIGARGNPDSPVVIISESPSSQDIAQGVPLVGPQGSVLTKALPLSFDIDRDAYVINAFQCLAPKFPQQSKNDAAKETCTRGCRSRVLSQIWRHPRQLIITMGKWANASLFGEYDFKITQHRGELLVLPDPNTGNKVIVAPIVHPASLIRGMGSFKLFQADINKALTAANFIPPTTETHKEYVEPSEVIISTLEELTLLCSDLMAYGEAMELGSDLETTGFDPRLDRILIWSLTPDKPFRGATNTAYIIQDTVLYNREAIDLLNNLSAAEHLTFTWQNGKFDWGFLNNMGINASIDEDTMLMSYALDESSGGHDLEEIAKNNIGAPSYKGVIDTYINKKTQTYADVPRAVLNHYAAMDTKNTVESAQVQRVLITADVHLKKLYYKTLLPASALLAEIERRGIFTDLSIAQENRIYLEQQQLEAIQDLADIAGYHVNPNSPQQVSKLLYQDLGLRIKGKIPLGTDQKIMDKLPQHPAIRVIKRYRRSVKMLSTYVSAVEKFRDADGRVHTTFKLHVTTTGRLSSSRPNIQNVPREGKYRQMYCAPPGRVLLEGDYNTAELRMLAALSEDEFLCSVFLDGSRNLHDEVSIKMYGADFTPDQRIRAKAINFGIPYGRESFSIAMEFDILNKEAQDMIDSWFATAPGAAKFIKACRAAPGKGQSLITVFGRKRRPGLVTEMRMKELQNEFANFFMQSTISDFTLHAAIRINERIKPLDSYIVNLVHDSVLTECPEDPVIVKQVAQIVKEEMQGVPKLWVTTPIEFTVDFKSGTHWGMLKHFEL